MPRFVHDRQSYQARVPGGNVVGSQETHVDIAVILCGSGAARKKDNYSILEITADSAKADRGIPVERSNRCPEVRAGLLGRFDLGAHITPEISETWQTTPVN